MEPNHTSMSETKALLQRYDRPGPRYTSYPTAPSWTDDFGGEDHRQSLLRASEHAGAPLSIYVHIPFCESLCLYCGCSVLITQQQSKGIAYVDELLAEADLVRRSLTAERPVVQHHWGGGTPTFLPPDELVRLFEGLAERFPVAEDEQAEVSIEVDPRVTTTEQLEALRRVGFNRISMGVQDFTPKVQETIHRVQSYELTRDLVNAARDLGFQSVNLDLVYGLPYQTVEDFEETIQKVLTLSPDRLACYSYAHVPWLKKHQRVFDEASLPSAELKMQLYLTALGRFTENGYAVVGMDHFAKTTDALAVAADSGNLHRNFMGYTTRPASDMVSLGMTSISEVQGAFAQNLKSLGEWRASIERGELPVTRGLRRSADDEARRALILDLMCRFRLEFEDHGSREVFLATYSTAIETLKPMAKDGLCSIDENGISVTKAGRLFVRNLAMPFDAYLKNQQKGGGPVYSRTV
ncbi:MAG: oxygen-independent coproporphyrinogen III oxidase [Planctomycetota bacterium]